MIFSRLQAGLSALLLSAIAFGSGEGQATHGFYTTVKNVSQHARIDLDVIQIARFARAGNFSSAISVYEEGMHSAKSESVLRILQGFSTGIAPKVEGIQTDKANGKILPEYGIYRDFWGVGDDYANQFVMDALEGDGNALGLDQIARYQLGVKGIQYQVIWMYVLYELAKSVSLCFNDGDGMKNWDEGAVFYIGSRIDARATTSGALLYTLAERRCRSFGTCTGNGRNEPKAAANVAVIRAFNRGKRALAKKDCKKLSEQYQKIVKQMAIPLIQGTLLYASRAESGKSKDMAEAWAFAAAVLPLIDQADSSSAEIIRTNLEFKSGVNKTVPNGKDPIFKAVYKALPAMCISCEEIGVNNFKGAPACVSDMEALGKGCSEFLQPLEEEKETNTGLIVGLSVAAVVVIAALLVAIRFVTKSETPVSD